MKGRKGQFLKLTKSAKIINIFYIRLMSTIEPLTPRVRRISKRHKQFDSSLTFPRRILKTLKMVGQTPKKNDSRHLDDDKTIKAPQKLHPSMAVPVNLNFYQSSNSYTLGSINSVTFSKQLFIQAMAEFMTSFR